ncbi:hypothetical protein PSE_3073 [Pseudovibrio sp. FO-BEG1]|nr:MULTISPECIES: hypothetical protein [Pseudovibrio]AEV37581.1 hypothetical protein PSE_3073 [Pseudovibrio sp. FO-BEG1]
MSDTKRPATPKGNFIYRRFRRVKNSDRLLDAHDYGYEAWPIPIKR